MGDKQDHHHIIFEIKEIELLYFFYWLQEVVTDLIQIWKEENTGQQFHLRLKGDNNTDDSTGM